MNKWVNDHWEQIFNAEIMKYYINKKMQFMNGGTNSYFIIKHYKILSSFKTQD